MTINGDFMSKEEYGFFHAALNHLIKKEKELRRARGEGFNQGKYGSEAFGVSESHFNGIMSGRMSRVAGTELQDQIAKHFGMTLWNFKKLGRELLLGGGDRLRVETKSIGEGALLPSEESTTVKPSERRDPLAGIGSFISAYRDIEWRLELSRACWDAMPFPVCIVDHGNKVIFQNQADRSFYRINIVGEVLCPACRDNCEIPHPCDDCAVRKVLEIGEPAERVVTINGKKYLVTASPVKISRGDFVVITVFNA